VSRQKYQQEKISHKKMMYNQGVGMDGGER
jgi:hypothetical protein